jgi:hypothetical protein
VDSSRSGYRAHPAPPTSRSLSRDPARDDPGVHPWDRLGPHPRRREHARVFFKGRNPRPPPLFARSPRSLPQAAAGIASNPGILFAAAARTRDRRALVVIALAYSFVGSDFRGLRRAAGFWWFSAGYAIADKLRLVDASVDLCVGWLLRIPTAALAWVCGSGPIPPRKPAASWPVTLLLLCAWVALPYSFDATLAANGVTVSTIRAFIAYENAQIDDH